MTYRTLMAAFAGYAIGNLPDSSVSWLAIKLMFTIALVLLLVQALRKETT